MENGLAAVLDSTRNSILHFSSLTSKLWKTCKVILSGILIGFFDAWQIKHLGLGRYGVEAAILYQVGLMMVCGVAAIVSLYDKSWSPERNALSVLVTLPIATIADNVSLDLQTLKPYVVILPRIGYAWRWNVFGHTFLSPLANWVDQQTFAPGLLDGYLAAIVIGIVYILVQYFWAKI